MPKTTIEQAVERVVDDLCKNDKKYYSFLQETAHSLYRGNTYSESYVDCIMQKSFRDPAYTMYDAYCFLQVNCFIQSGEVCVFQVPSKAYPGSDKGNENQKILDALPYPFSGKFISQRSGDDGCLTWARPINAVLTMRHKNTRSFVLVPPFEYCPLEVGTTSAEKTLFYLSSKSYKGESLARWPYHQEYITVFTRNFVGAGGHRFEHLRENVWGNFDSLPWAHDGWDKEAHEQGIVF